MCPPKKITNQTSTKKRPPKKMANQTSTKNVHQIKNLKELGVVEKTSTKTWYTVLGTLGRTSGATPALLLTQPLFPWLEGHMILHPIYITPNLHTIMRHRILKSAKSINSCQNLQGTHPSSSNLLVDPHACNELYEKQAGYPGFARGFQRGQ